MSSPVTSHHSTVWLSYHQLQLRDLEGLPPAHPGRFPNGLIAIGGEPDEATIITGIAMGVVDVTVELATSSPPILLDEWEEAVETSIESTTGSLYVCGLDADLPDDLPNLAFRGTGLYRLRVCAKGRDINVDGVAKEPIGERYLIQVWPDLQMPEIVLKRSDNFGAQRRAM